VIYHMCACMHVCKEKLPGKVQSPHKLSRPDFDIFSGNVYLMESVICIKITT
jgi:hypothetical protein